MIEEIDATVDWWSNQIKRSILNSSHIFKLDDKQNELIINFKNSLKTLLLNKYDKHWYIDEPMRGSAYRSLAFDHCMDPTLLKAAEMCGIQLRRIESLLAHTRTVIIFVNPGEVKLMNIIGGSHKSHPEPIYQKGKIITNIPEPELNNDKNKEETECESDEEQQQQTNNRSRNGTYTSPKGITPLKSNPAAKPYEYSRSGYNQNLNYSYDNNNSNAYYGQSQQTGQQPYAYPNLPYAQRPNAFSNNF